MAEFTKTSIEYKAYTNIQYLSDARNQKIKSWSWPSNINKPLTSQEFQKIMNTSNPAIVSLDSNIYVVIYNTSESNIDKQSIRKILNSIDGSEVIILLSSQKKIAAMERIDLASKCYVRICLYDMFLINVPNHSMMPAKVRILNNHKDEFSIAYIKKNKIGIIHDNDPISIWLGFKVKDIVEVLFYSEMGYDTTYFVIDKSATSL
jgi:DNA-directed RNA polymerase subunit H (RpoH/RPB5)